jgi:cardiolipin synthase (CMP-forming)
VNSQDNSLGPFLTVPNVISLARLLAIPVFVWLLFAQDDRLNAAILLAVLGGSDWVDGYIARRFDQGSEIGKILDPTADRLMFIVSITAMIIDGSVAKWFAIAVLVRETAFAIGVVGLAAAGAKRRISVTWLGKTATFGLMVAFPLFLVGHADVQGADTWRLLGWLFGIPALVLSYYTIIEYIPIAKKALADGRYESLGSSEDPDALV